MSNPVAALVMNVDSVDLTTLDGHDDDATDAELIMWCSRPPAQTSPARRVPPGIPDVMRLVYRLRSHRAHANAAHRARLDAALVVARVRCGLAQQWTR